MYWARVRCLAAALQRIRVIESCTVRAGHPFIGSSGGGARGVKRFPWAQWPFPRKATAGVLFAANGSPEHIADISDQRHRYGRASVHGTDASG